MKHSIEDMFRYYRYFERNPNSKILKQNGGLWDFLKDFCNRTLGLYLYVLLSRTPSESCLLLRTPIEQLINLTQMNLELGSVVPRARKIVPDDLSGKLILSHGLIESPVTKFTVPHNTYIIYLTPLGEMGDISNSEINFVELMRNNQITKELLYLLTFDYKDEYLQEIPYFKKRIIYTPYSYCNDTTVATPNYSSYDCFRYYNKMDDNGVVYDFKTAEVQEQLDSVYSYMGIFDIPIEELPQKMKEQKNVYFVYKNTETGELRQHDKYLPNPPSNFVLHKLISAENRIYKNKQNKVISTKDKRKQEMTNRTFKEVESDRGKIYHCYAKYSEYDNPDRPFKIVQDYTEDSRPNIKMSELVIRMRAECDEKYGKEKKLVIVTPLCRSLSQLDDSEQCIRLENRMVELLSKIQKTTEEIDLLKDCLDKIRNSIDLEELRIKLGEASSSMGVEENNSLSRQIRKRVTKDIRENGEAKKKR